MLYKDFQFCFSYDAKETKKETSIKMIRFHLFRTINWLYDWYWLDEKKSGIILSLWQFISFVLK